MSLFISIIINLIMIPFLIITPKIFSNCSYIFLLFLLFYFFTLSLAKTVSRVLTQNASLHASYLTFLKQSGSPRHLNISFVIPNYIQDIYYFCTIARQIFLNSLVLTRVAVGAQSTSGDKKSQGKKITEKYFKIL